MPAATRLGLPHAAFLAVVGLLLAPAVGAAPIRAEVIEAVEAADQSVARLRVDWKSTTTFDPTYAADFAWCWCARRNERGWVRPAAGIRGPTRHSVTADGGRWRGVAGEGAGAPIECYDGAEYWCLNRGRRPTARTWVERHPVAQNTRHGVLSPLLLSCPVGSWPDLVRSRVQSIADGTCLGEPAVEVELSDPDDPTAATRVWFVPSRGWRAGRVQELASDTVLVDTTVDEWQRVDGLWLPRRVASAHYDSPEPTTPVSLWMTIRAEVLEVSLPAVVPESEFRIDLGSLAEGTLVEDSVDGVHYEIGPANNAARDLVIDAVVRSARNTPRDGEPDLPIDLAGRRSASPISMRGPEALALLLRYLGEAVTAADLVPEQLDGLAGLVDEAAGHGVSLQVVELTYEDLVETDEPAVILLGPRHWALFVGERAGSVYVVEPPDLVRAMRPEDFRAKWLGEALMLHEGP